MIYKWINETDNEIGMQIPSYNPTYPEANDYDTD